MLGCRSLLSGSGRFDGAIRGMLRGSRGGIGGLVFRLMRDGGDRRKLCRREECAICLEVWGPFSWAQLDVQ